MKVWLVLPPMERETEVIRQDFGWWMPLGLLSVATFLSSQCPDVQIRILDGEVMGYREMKQIFESCDADIVGICSNIVNYEIALELAEIAKERGSKVGFGGHHATTIAEEILHRRLFVDYCFRGDGEVAFTEVVKGKAPSLIPNLSYRDKVGVVHNPVVWLDLDALPSIDYGLINPIPYWVNHLENYSLSSQCPYKRPMAVVSQRGCLWRQKTGGCLFCSRMEKNWRGRNPISVWQEIRRWQKEWGIDSIIDVSDDFLTNPQWFDAFYKDRLEIGVGIRYIYVRPDNIFPRTADQLRELGLWVAFQGDESGSPPCLQDCNKGFSVEQQRSAVELLTARGIWSTLSFVLGFRPETRKTLQQTYEHIKGLLGVGLVDILAVQILNPTPGSRAWKLLLQTEEGKSFIGKDIIGIEDLQRAWVKAFCEVSYDELKDWQARMLDLQAGSIADYSAGIV